MTGNGAKIKIVSVATINVHLGRSGLIDRRHCDWWLYNWLVLVGGHWMVAAGGCVCAPSAGIAADHNVFLSAIDVCVQQPYGVSRYKDTKAPTERCVLHGAFKNCLCICACVFTGCPGLVGWGGSFFSSNAIWKWSFDISQLRDAS